MEKLISEIKIGDRFRRDLGDVQELANSIEEHGLLQPVGILLKTLYKRYRIV